MTAALRSYTALFLAFMYLPVAVVGLFSFNADDMIAFPLSGFTLDWYAEVLTDGRLLGGFLTTLSVAMPVTAISTILGTLAALVLVRGNAPLRSLFLFLVVAPFFIPRIIGAVSQVVFYQEVGVVKSLLTVCIGQSLIIIPFTTMIVASVLVRMDPALEEAAADLGANAWQRLMHVVLPLIRPGLMAGAFVSFVLSTSEYTVSYFTSGRGQPLSILIASDFRFHLSPALNALAMLIVALNVVLVILSEILRRRGSARLGPRRGG